MKFVMYLIVKITHLFKVHSLLITLSLHMTNLKKPWKMETEATSNFTAVGYYLPRNEEIIVLFLQIPNGVY